MHQILSRACRKTPAGNYLSRDGRWLIERVPNGWTVLDTQGRCSVIGRPFVSAHRAWQWVGWQMMDDATDAGRQEVGT